MIISPDDFNYWFKDMNWSISKNSIKFQGARQPNGSGSDYYYDLEVGICYQCTAYWQKGMQGAIANANKCS